MTRFLRLSLTAALGLTACGDDSGGATTNTQTDPAASAGTTSSGGAQTTAETTAPNATTETTEDASGTSGSIPEVPSFVGGERLLARVETSVDGVQRFAGFHDTELDQDCVFVQTGSDTRHCLPAFFVGGATEGEEGCPGASVAVSSCELPSEVTTRDFECGEIGIAGASSVGASCGPNNRLELEPLPLSRYVSGQPSTSVTVGALRWTRIEAEDGAVFTEGPEAIAGPSCFPSSTWPDICQPRNMPFATGTLHADVTCSGDLLIANVLDNDCEPPMFARGPSDTVFRLRRPWDGPLYSGTGANDCNEASISETVISYQVEPASAGDLPPLDSTLIGSERLQARVILHPETDDIVWHTGWYDRELGGICSRSTAPSGLDVCAPSRSNSPFYADPACTDLLVWGGDGPEPRSVYAAGTCTFRSVQGVAFPGEPYDGQAYALNTEGDCVEVSTAAPPRRIAEWIAADDLPQLSVGLDG